MGDWSYLSALLDKVQSHSTVVGKVWMSVLFLFRVLVLGAAADGVWGDEHSEFSCNTAEPGCDLACYDWLFPVSHVRYWTLQVVFVSTPTLVYLGHAVHVVHREKRLRERLQQQQRRSGPTDVDVILKRPRYTDERGKVKIKGALLRSYLLQLLFKVLLEVGFSVGQVYLYGRGGAGGGGGDPPSFLSSVSMVSVVHCRRDPCPELSGVECFVSRPTEKSVFIVFMLAVSGASVLLNVLEVVYLLCGRRRANRKKKDLAARVQQQQQQQHHPNMAVDTSQQLLASSPEWTPASVNNRHGGSGAGGALSMQPPSHLPRDLSDTCIDLVNKEKCT